MTNLKSIMDGGVIQSEQITLDGRLRVTPSTPYYIKIDNEILEVESDEGFDFNRNEHYLIVRRGAKNTVVAPHAVGATIYMYYGKPPQTRPIGLGNQLLIDGENYNYGYYGKYKGIASPNEIISLGGITEGITKSDAYNNPDDTINWLKCSHNYKTLFIADRTIHYGVSWHHLNDKGLIFGKVVTIEGRRYLLRVLQGAIVNPATENDLQVAYSNSEFYSLLEELIDYREWDIPNINSAGGEYTICQETSSLNISNFIAINPVTSDYNVTHAKSSKINALGYRPVLEVL